ncbi:unnamed protein product [Candidula unifasciata]|uniref:EF-hand domain-containing protein n=1 Tax=Candidula unifasciata TaxID=100452 RepID=A0A8S3ZQA7_9EUPU|nr:unnamed protein product [Candidula unifasciata]
MYQLTHIFLMLAVSGCACAVFYTKSTDNDYPRIGRRTFYTTGSGIHYPRIGRRDAAGSQLLLPGVDFSDMATFEKRGVFTQSAHGSYPRVGRGSEESASGEDYLNERGNKFLARIAGFKDDIEESSRSKGDNSKQEDSSSGNSPLDIMFTAFDVDSDGKLSKEEFSSGLRKYRQQTTVC